MFSIHRQLLQIIYFVLRSHPLTLRFGEKLHSIAIYLDNNDARLVNNKNDRKDSAIYRNTFKLAVDGKHVRDFNYFDKRPSD